MQIRKEAAVQATGAPTPTQLEKINCLTKTPLTEQQVYVFSLRLCDDQPDRDFERFDTQALPILADLFVGKTGIADHRWSTHQQVARIFDTEVLEQDGVSYIKAWVYTLNNEEHRALIADIEGGLKKEVSVGCSMGQRLCSICGASYGTCRHQKGQTYEETTCVAVLTQPLDAYEFSFVAVPAQPKAGVMKAWKGGETMTLKELIDNAGQDVRAEYETICAQAAAGKAYEDRLRQQVIRQSLLLNLGLKEPVLRQIADKLSCKELSELHQALEEKTAALFPPSTQLPGRSTKITAVESEFLI